MKQKLFTVATACVGLAAVALAGSPALADPIGTPTFRALAGVGSDTTQDILNGLSEVVTINGVKQIGSYDATGSATISPKNTAACTNIPRPNGSSAGKNALIANNPAGCYQFARSSSGPNSTTFPGVTSIPFALDGLTFAVTASSSFPKSLTLDELKAIYRCESIGAGLQPTLPQLNSGTKDSWATLMTGSRTGLDTRVVNAGEMPNAARCITLTQEHDARSLTNSQIAPFSVAKSIGMQGGVIADQRGQSVLGAIGGSAPLQLNAAQQSTRVVYNVVRSAELNDPTIDAVFTGADSLVCQATATIIAQGFAPVTNCGATNFSG